MKFRPDNQWFVSFAACLWLMVAACSFAMAQSEEPKQNSAARRGDLLIVVGSPGTDEYRNEFQKWAKQWTTAAVAGQFEVVALGTQSNNATLEKLQTMLATLAKEDRLPLWIVLIGHGTFDGRTAKFNLPEADLQPEELQRLLKEMNRPIAVINCTSASAPFLKALSFPQRIVVTATSSGNEINFAHFGQFLADAISNKAADLDKDDQVSLLEAFLSASKRTEEFYKSDGRLPTEHARLDDNGDGRPVSASDFDGVQAIDREDNSRLLPDGIIAHQWHLIPSAAEASLSPEVLARRNEIELQITALRQQKSTMNEDDYYAALEPLFIELAKLLIKHSEQNK